MRHFLYLFLFLFLFNACNKDEGLGGSSSLEGYVYNIVHQDDNNSFTTDTFPGIKKDVYIIYGDQENDYFGDDVETNQNGLYRFDYLRKGNYIIYAYSEFADGQKEAVMKKVKVSGDLNKADAIFIHTGKASGTAMVKGIVWIKYYNKGRLVQVNGQDSVPAVESRVFIKYAGEDTYFDDVRVGDKGIFVFQKILPGRQYEVYVNTEMPGEEYKNILFPVYKTVEVSEPYRIYPLEQEDKLEFTIIVNN
jgi:hypothetical protein